MVASGKMNEVMEPLIDETLLSAGSFVVALSFVVVEMTSASSSLLIIETYFSEMNSFSKETYGFITLLREFSIITGSESASASPLSWENSIIFCIFKQFK